MRHALPLLDGRLGCADVQVSKNLNGIVVDDLTGEGFR
jgi:hypothetical protein